MPSKKIRNTLARQWELLKILPTHGSGKSSRELTDALVDQGFIVSKRQVERDLSDLQEILGIECNDDSIPYRWRWSSSGLVDFPSVTLAEALSLQIVKETLHPLLPNSVQRALLPRFELAKSKLDALSIDNPIAKWRDKVKTVFPSMPMSPPEIDETILETVQTALLNDEQIDIIYGGYGDEPKPLCLHPLGLVIRGSVSYLVATAFDYKDVRLYALHRIQAASRNYVLSNKPKGFDLSKYVDAGALQFGTGSIIKLVAIISADLAKRLTETALSADQIIDSYSDNFKLTATVLDTWQLNWWILSQESNIEIVSPAQLRKGIIDQLSNALNQYK